MTASLKRFQKCSKGMPTPKEEEMSTLVIESIRRSCGYLTTKAMIRSGMRYLKGCWYSNDTILDDSEKGILIQKITSAIEDIKQLSTGLRTVAGTAAQLICTRNPYTKNCFNGNVGENLIKLIVEINQTGKLNTSTLKHLEKYIKFVHAIVEEMLYSIRMNRIEIDEPKLLNYNNGWSFKVNFINY